VTAVETKKNIDLLNNAQSKTADIFHGATKAVTDGYLANVRQEQSTTGLIKESNTYEAVVKRLKDQLVAELTPLLNLTNSFDDLGIKLHEVRKQQEGILHNSKQKAILGFDLTTTKIPNFFDLNISVPGVSLPKIDPFNDKFQKAFTDSKTFEGILKVEEEFKKITSETKLAAEAIDQVLTPAFQSMFSAIVSGENPIKAFFNSIAQAIEQVITKLIAAATEALILNLIFPGGGSYGTVFKKLVGLGGIANVGFASAGGGSIASPGKVQLEARGSVLVGVLALGGQQQRRVNGS
jgi:hypothetical protein